MSDLAIDPALARAIAEAPEDEGAWIVLEDWLIAHGDPRARLAELQRLGDRHQLAEERHRLGPVLLGPNHARLERTLSTSLWRGGFVRRAHLFVQPYEVASLLSSFLASPAAQFLSQLHVAEAGSLAILSTIARAPLLREVRLRVADPINRTAEPAFADLDLLAPLVHLESLHLDNVEGLSGGHRRVRFLTLSTRRPVVLSRLAAKLPALESLDLACLELAHIGTRIAAWPALWHLGIQVDTCEPDPLAAIVPSGLLAQLDRLRISDGEPTTVPPVRGMWPKRRVAIELDEHAKRRLYGGTLARIERVYLAPPLADAGPYPCPCCRYPTLPEPPPGTFAICPVCFWEDDNVQAADPTYHGGANQESLSEARATFAKIGVCHPRHAEHVRSPTAEEIRGRAT